MRQRHIDIAAAAAVAAAFQCLRILTTTSHASTAERRQAHKHVNNLVSSTYLGVLPLVLSALNRAFSAPRICTVEAGHLASEVKLPALEMSRAATVSPISVARFGATVPILSTR
jgi:hypothetical protein